MGDLKIVVYVTEDYQRLFKFIFKASLLKHEPAVLESDIKVISPSKYDGHYNFAGQTSHQVYKQMMLDRIKAYQALMHSNVGKKILFFDCDVIFLRPFKQEIMKYLEEYDMVFQKNYIAGIWGVNCNSQSLNFIDTFVRYIENIDPEDRQDGYPQFELGEMIVKFKEASMLSVLELPQKFGFLAEDTCIYHAINGGKTAETKELTLYAACAWCHYMQQTPQELLFPTDGVLELFLKMDCNALYYFTCIRERDKERVEEFLRRDHHLWVHPGGAGDLRVEQEIFETLEEETLLPAWFFSWLPKDETNVRETMTLTLTKEMWLAWMTYLNEDVPPPIAEVLKG